LSAFDDVIITPEYSQTNYHRCLRKRLRHQNKNVKIPPSRSQVAAKFLDDSYYPNLFYSQIGGITLKELNFLEVEFLFGLNFSLHVTPPEYRRYYMGLSALSLNVH